MRLCILASRRLTIGLLLAVLVSIGASLYGAGVAQGHEGARFDLSTALLASDRPGLKICVQSLVPGVDARTIQSRVQGALTGVSKHPDFARAGLDRQPVAIDVGCPIGPTITNPRYSGKDMSGVPAIVTAPSPYRLFVFVATPEQVAQAFTWQPRLTPQEMICERDGCNEITAALYLTPSELTDLATLARGLTQGVGLWPEGRARNNPAFDPTGR